MNTIIRVIPREDSTRVILDSRQFKDKWPCSDIPDHLWAEFDNFSGDLVDISDNTGDCDVSGGLSEFLDDVRQFIYGIQTAKG